MGRDDVDPTSEHDPANSNSHKQPKTATNAKRKSIVIRHIVHVLLAQLSATTIAAARTGTVYRNNNKPDVMSGNTAETDMIQPIQRKFHHSKYVRYKQILPPIFM